MLDTTIRLLNLFANVTEVLLLLALIKEVTKQAAYARRDKE